ncbi:Protein CBG10393, partial [Caenorhabditis briggsae]
FVLDFTEPKWLILYYHVIGVLSINLNIFCIYLLQYQCKQLEKFRYWIIAYQVGCFITDIIITVLMQPVPLYPLLACYTVGILSSWFDIQPVYSCYIVCDFIAVQFVLLGVSFVKKHRTVSSLADSFAFPIQFDYLIFFFLIFGIVVGDLFAYSERLTEEEQWELIKEVVPNYVEGFRSLPNFVVIPRSPYVLYPLFFVLFIGILVVVSVFLLIFDTFRKMHRLKQKVALVNYQRHAQGVRFLVVQVIKAGLSMFPILILAVSLLFALPDAQKTGQIYIACFTAHSSLNIIALLIFFPPFKLFLKKNL